MHFNNLGLPVRDERRSQQFYSAYFGFDPDGHRIEVYWERSAARWLARGRRPGTVRRCAMAW
jgi:hypothetical protein